MILAIQCDIVCSKGHVKRIQFGEARSNAVSRKTEHFCRDAINAS